MAKFSYLLNSLLCALLFAPSNSSWKQLRLQLKPLANDSMGCAYYHIIEERHTQAVVGPERSLRALHDACRVNCSPFSRIGDSFTTLEQI
jgi:hypothetical protein